jgi:hypothetical protein
MGSARPEQPIGPPVAVAGDAAGVAWYAPAAFRAWREAGVEVAPGCEGWDAWFATYQQAFIRLRDQRLRPYKIVVDPQALAAWLAERGLADGAEPRSAYVAERLRLVLLRTGAP